MYVHKCIPTAVLEIIEFAYGFKMAKTKMVLKKKYSFLILLGSYYF